MEVQIVRAEPNDAPLLKKIAVASKSHWGYPEHLISQWAETPIITSTWIEKDIVYTAQIDNEIIGWYRVLADSSLVTLEDLWMLPAYIGKGIGRLLFEHAMQQARLHNARFVELDADPNARLFYEKMGCTQIGETVSEWGRKIPRMRYSFENH